MSSRRSCFVYLHLPGALAPVTCGRYEREVLDDGRAVGRFVYGRSYRARPDAVPLDPYHLPLAPTRYETARLEGIFGAIRDAMPDAWGQRVIEKVLGRSGLDPFDYLLNGPDDRAGALTFGLGPSPPPPKHVFNRVLDLAALREAVRLLEETGPGAEVPEQVRQLRDPGTSLGGARPKAVVADEHGIWIAKFPQRGDRWNNAAVEAGMLALAARCGIRTPETRVERMGAEAILLVRRFDRTRVEGGWLRHRMVSALTVLDADDRVTARENWSYLRLADELTRWSGRAAADRRELFRRVAFNALVSNTDDHPRNHALVAPGPDWGLAPAYDITPSPLVSLDRRDLAMECGPLGRIARRDNLIAGAPRFGLEPGEAARTFDELKATVAGHWRAEVARHGGTAGDCAAIERAFVHGGFEYPAVVS